MKLLDRRFLNISLTVLGVHNSPDANPATGTQYIVGSNPTGNFASASPNQIARFDGYNWSFITPKAGELEVLNADTGEILQFNGEEWVTVASLGGEAGSSFSIPVVDDIIYGYHDAYAYGGSTTLSPANLKALRGRVFLTIGDGYFNLVVDNVLESGRLGSGIAVMSNINAPAAFAGFGDSKIHSITHDENNGDVVISTTLNNGEYIFNKADNSLYCYDATNHKFVKVGGKHSYVVDALVDYVGTNLPASFNSGYASLVKLEGSNVSFNYTKQGNTELYFELNAGFSFANIQSIFSDDAGIYSVCGDDDKGVRVLHDLYDGDSIFCKADGCTYIFKNDGTNKSFVKASDSFIAPVLDIVPAGINLPDNPTAAGDKYLYIDTYGTMSAYLYTAVDADNWDNGTSVQNGERYISSTDFKIYTFFVGNNSSYFLRADVPVGASFLNKADNCLYVYDGTGFINVTLDPEKNPFVAPVIDILPVGDNRPDYPSAAGDKFILYDPDGGSGSTGDLSVAISDSDWGNSTAIPAGSRYASTTDHKFYVFQGNNNRAVISDIQVNSIFLNKADNCLYLYDGLNFIKTGGSGGSSSESYEPIAPVLDILNIGSNQPDYPSAAGDKFIFYDPDESQTYGELYIAPSSADWGNGTNISAGQRYASLNEHKIYVFQGDGNEAIISDIPVGATFLNKNDNCLYTFDGSSFVKSASYEPVAPVLAIVPSGSALPANAATGDAFLNTSNAKLYTATAANTWDSGTLTANGSRYASSTDYKIYVSNGTALTATNILNGDLFLNKEENIVYAYDDSVPAFVKVGTSSLNITTENHSLTAADVNAKSFSLSNNIAAGQESNTLLFVSGIAQTVGVDFSASGNSISWNNKALDDIALTAGDSFLVQYIRG